MNLCLPEKDFSSVLSGFCSWRVMGSYKPNDPWTIYLDKEFNNNKEKKEDVYYHEWMHLQLFTSTAYGHVQQLFTSFVIGLQNSGMPAFSLSPIFSFLTSLYETSWEVHEGAATIGSFLLQNPFSVKLVNHAFYSELPARYSNAASHFAAAVGALLPIELARFGHIAVNAVAQFCLNTDIITYSTGYWRKFKLAGQSESYDIFSHLSKDINNPQCRLYKLIGELYKDEQYIVPTNIKNNFIDSIKNFDFVKVQKDGNVSIEAKSREQMLELQDSLNFVILKELDSLIPGWLKYKRVIEMENDLIELYQSHEDTGWVKHNWDSMAKDIKRRAAFRPNIKPT